MFDIRLDRRGRLHDAAGEIVIGDFREFFTFDLSAWSAHDYRASWARSAAHVLEGGFGRFLVSVGAPGAAMYDTWPCWRRGDEAVVLHSLLLSTLTRDFVGPEDAEAFDATPPEADPSSHTLKLYRCALADIVDFERRLRGASAQ